MTRLIVSRICRCVYARFALRQMYVWYIVERDVTVNVIERIITRCNSIHREAIKSPKIRGKRGVISSESFTPKSTKLRWRNFISEKVWKLVKRSVNLPNCCKCVRQSFFISSDIFNLYLIANFYFVHFWLCFLQFLFYTLFILVPKLKLSRIMRLMKSNALEYVISTIFYADFEWNWEYL